MIFLLVYCILLAIVILFVGSEIKNDLVSRKLRDQVSREEWFQVNWNRSMQRKKAKALAKRMNKLIDRYQYEKFGWNHLERDCNQKGNPNPIA
jgi:hypothetical protein